MNKSSINWLQFPGYIPATYSPYIGCNPISPGCAHCWARREEDGRFRHLMRCGPLAYRNGKPRNPYFNRGPVYQGDEKLMEPPRARKPRCIFVCPRSDLFHDKISDGEIDAVYNVIAQATHHLFVICTKRARRMARWYKWYQADSGEYLPNLILMVTCETQKEADERVPYLLECPAVCHAVSHEPALGPVNWSPWLPRRECDGCGQNMSNYPVGYLHEYPGDPPEFCGKVMDRHGISWLICGAESGPNARPMDEAWVRQDRDQCAAAGVPFFYKQRREGKKMNHLPQLDGRTHRELPDMEREE